jgi:hypothetical protein
VRRRVGAGGRTARSSDIARPGAIAAKGPGTRDQHGPGTKDQARTKAQAPSPKDQSGAILLLGKKPRG